MFTTQNICRFFRNRFGTFQITASKRPVTFSENTSVVVKTITICQTIRDAKRTVIMYIYLYQTYFVLNCLQNQRIIVIDWTRFTGFISLACVASSCSNAVKFEQNLMPVIAKTEIFAECIMVRFISDRANSEFTKHATYFINIRRCWELEKYRLAS